MFPVPRYLFFFLLPLLLFLQMVHLCDEISCGELFKALSSTLDQFPLVGIFDWGKRGLICER